MSIDMRLASVKDGGKFAMMWIAGTNPKALRSNFQRSQIYSIDVTEVCEEIIGVINSKGDKPSFRVLFRLFFGTIRIYSEQVQHVYSVTQNFVCSNSFIVKQYSRKRTSSMVSNNNGAKRQRLESSGDFDISKLLMESEIFNEYSEDKFKFPKEISSSGKKIHNTSTCIQINQITIRQISWDTRHPDAEEEFGEATQDDRNMFLSELSDTVDESMSIDSSSRKRKSSNTTTECSPFKKPYSVFNDSIDEVRCALSSCNDTMSEISVDQSLKDISQADKSYHNPIQNTQDSLISTQDDMTSQSHFQSNESILSIKSVAVDDTNASFKSHTVPDVLLTNVSIAEVKNPNILKEIVQQKPKPQRKRSHIHLILDKETTISTKDMESSLENVWLNCYDKVNKEHIAHVEKYDDNIYARIPNRRFQSDQLLASFKYKLKARLMQADDIRQLIVSEFLDDEYEIYKLFHIKPMKRTKSSVSFGDDTSIEKRAILAIDMNNNVPIDADLNNNCLAEPDGYCEKEYEKVMPSLKCSLNEVDLNQISFNFPTEPETGKRSVWGKEGILTKLLMAWRSQDSDINMKTIIVGANRINAALAFHTLLDLAGQQYITLVKDKTNSIESIKMGPAMITKLNFTYA